MKKNFLFRYFPFIIAGVILCLSITSIYLNILHKNNGIFIYTIDDPYIHLRLAQQIAMGHYGINANEFSSPSSSILWPLILVPFADYSLSPLFINIFLAFATLFIAVEIIKKSFGSEVQFWLIAATSVLFIIATNMLGLVFLGMEHVLQVFLIALIALGVIEFYESNKVSYFFIFALFLAPLVRYENLAIVLFACAYLFFTGKKQFALVLCIVILTPLILFSLFLRHLDLPLLPCSVLAKISDKHSLFSSFLKSPKQIPGVLLALTMIATSIYFYLSNNKNRFLALWLFSCISAHLLLGKFGWFHRYEIYIWSLTLLIGLYLIRPFLEPFYSRRFGQLILLFIFIFFVHSTCYDYIKGIGYISKASHNTYQQQYQMRRFAQNFYKKPVAVNDIGLVTYNNQNYVLDLWGLASFPALKNRTSAGDDHWIEAQVNNANIGVVMIYDEWFKNIPDSWISLGVLSFQGKRITPAKKQVHFYATSADAKREALAILPEFVASLPDDVSFLIE